MSAPPEELPVLRQWIEKAERDLKTAEHTLTLPDDCPFDMVCFHAHQCVEKYLKGYMLSRGQSPLRTHDLRVLLQRVEEVHALDLQVEELVPLNRYAVEARYPGDWEPISRTEAQDAVATARKVRTVIRTHLPAQALE